MERYIGDKVIFKLNVHQEYQILDFYIEAIIIHLDAKGNPVIFFLDPIEKKYKTRKVKEGQIL